MGNDENNVKKIKTHEGHDVNGTIVYSDNETIENNAQNKNSKDKNKKNHKEMNRSFSQNNKRNNNNNKNNINIRNNIKINKNFQEDFDINNNNNINYNYNNNNINNNYNNDNINNNNNNYNNNINNNYNNDNINNNNINENEKANEIYKKVNPEELHKITEFMRKCDSRYKQGLEEFQKKNFEASVVLFKKSLNSFISLNKIIHEKPEIYPKDFQDLMNQNINKKINLISFNIKNTELIIQKITVNSIKNLQKNMTLNNNNNNNGNINQNFNTMKNMNFNSMLNNYNNQLNNQINLRCNNNNNNKNNNNQNNKKPNIHDKEDTEMESKIESEIMSTIPNVSFSDVVGMDYLKQMINEIIILPTIRPDLFTGILQPQRGILLFGPPGTGKTMIAKAIASECKSTFFNISASSLTSKYVGESEKTVRALFKIAYQKEPSIIFIDEIDSVLSKRSDNDNEAAKRLKTEFLIQFDGLGSNSKAKLLVIAATNRPMDLDDALLRRLPKRVYCAPLDEKGRAAFIKKTIDLVDNNLNENDVNLIAKKTEGYSNSDLKELCKEAAFEPVRELNSEEILKLKKFRDITIKDMIKALGKIRGTLSKKVVKEIENWNNQFGGTE